MALHYRLAIFILLFTLSTSGCTALRPKPVAPPLVTPVAPTQVESTASPAAPSPTPSATLTSAPTPTEQAKLVLPIPKPLTSQAPWLMFTCDTPQANAAPTIANGDGTSCVPFTLPTTIQGDRSWISAAAPHGSYVAFRDAVQSPGGGSPAYRLQQNGFDDQIWIVKLPENRIIRQITQIDLDGWQRINQMWQGATGSSTNFVPLPLAVILDPGSYAWSPNGRFLAYTGVDKVGVDLFVYDSLTDTVRRMTRGHKGAFFWDWSPDGKWIVFHEMDRCEIQGRCILIRGQHYFAVTFPAPEYQFEYNFPVDTIDWISKDRLLLQDIPAAGQLSTHLVQIDLSSGAITTLYDQPFYSYTYVPKTPVSHQEMFLLNLPAAPSSNRATGIYILFPENKLERLRPFHTAKYADYTAEWERTIERFVLSKNLDAGSPNPISGSPSPKEVLLTNVLLLDPVPLGSLESSRLHLSPDGLWFTAQAETGSWTLYTAQGKPVLELGKAVPTASDPVTWLKDSSAFYFFSAGDTCTSSNGCINLYRKDQDWQPARVSELKSRPGNIMVIEP